MRKEERGWKNREIGGTVWVVELRLEGRLKLIARIEERGAVGCNSPAGTSGLRLNLFVIWAQLKRITD